MFKLIEEKIIWPLTHSKRCIIGWLGKTKQKWRNFEVLHRVRSLKLGPLSQIATKEQTGLELYQCTYGYPTANERLKNIFYATNNNIDEKACIAATYEIIQTKIFTELKNPELAFFCLDLSICRLFDHDILKILIDNLKDNERKVFSPESIIADLKKESIIEWDNERKAYSMDKMLRMILSKYLQQLHSQKYERNNNKMVEIYSDCIERLKEFRSIFMIEKLYHIARIEIHNNKPEPWKALEIELQKYFDKYYTKEKIKNRNIAKCFSEMISGDDELKDIIGDKGFIALRDYLENLNKKEAF